jgi:hypothetical protein
MKDLTYSDKVPTVPGFYFRRAPSGVTVIRLAGPIRLKRWEQLREERIASYPESHKARAGTHLLDA